MDGNRTGHRDPLHSSRAGHASPRLPTRWLGPTVGLLILAGCASTPPADPSAAQYQRYWSCAYAAAMPYAAERDLPPRQAAMRAQAECYTRYSAYRDAKVRHVRSVVPARDRQMAITLGTQAALERRKMVTQRLTELVAEAR